MNPWMSDPQFESSDATLLADRRGKVRTAPTIAGTHLWLDENRRLPVDVLDESADGIGIFLPCEIAFQIGPVVYVDYHCVRRPASVAYLAQHDERGYRLGLEWMRA